MKQYHEINFVRSVLILLVILVHIVYFGELYPTVKAGILGFMMRFVSCRNGLFGEHRKDVQGVFALPFPHLRSLSHNGGWLLSAFRLSTRTRRDSGNHCFGTFGEGVRVVDWPLLVSLCHDGMWHLLLSELQNSADREARRRAVDSVRWSFVSRFLSGATHDGEDCDVLFCGAALRQLKLEYSSVFFLRFWAVFASLRCSFLPITETGEASLSC